MGRVIKVGNAQGFWGDQPSAPRRLIEQAPDLDYLTLDYLAEVSLSIMAIQREKNPTLGYARDFIDVVKSLAPLWKAGCKTKVVCNAGGLNPEGCASACLEALKKCSCHHIKIGVVNGDDVLNSLYRHLDNKLFNHLESGQQANTIGDRFVTANAYLGAQPIAQALKEGADIVITGRVADPSLTVGPCLYEFGWSTTDYSCLAGATVAGHLIECGTQVTGGISNRWLELPDLAHIGFPIAEIDEQGNSIITKPIKSGGAVTIETVKEQLLYEIGDPAHYLSPDVTVSLLNLHIEQQAPNRVAITGAIGSAPPPSYKVSACYRDGFRADAMLTIIGRDAVKKAQRCGEVILERLAEEGYDVADSCIECLGSGDAMLGILSAPTDLNEIVLRLAVADPRHEAVETFTKLIAPMVTSGPAGCTGYTAGRPKVRPVFGYWPCLIASNQVSPRVTIMEVS